MRRIATVPVLLVLSTSPLKFYKLGTSDRASAQHCLNLLRNIGTWEIDNEPI